MAPTIASGVLLAVCGGFATVVVFGLVERAFSAPALARIGLPVSTAPFCLLASAIFLLIPTQSAGAGPTSDGGVIEGFGLLGAVIATAAADVVVGIEPASTGLMTYSGVLTAMALGAVVPVASSLKSRVGWAAAGVLVSVALTAALRSDSLPTFTWPFLFSTWVVLAGAAVGRCRRRDGSGAR
ncbi:urea transporter [Corynebacterium sanguinis]